MTGCPARQLVAMQITGIHNLTLLTALKRALKRAPSVLYRAA